MVAVQDGFRRSAGAWVRIWQFLVINLPSSISASPPKSGLAATAILTLNNTGLYSGTNSGTWCTPTSQATGLDVFVTYTGTLPSGTFNSWLSLATNRSWNISADPGENLSATLTFQFRKTGTTAVIFTDTVLLQANA